MTYHIAQRSAAARKARRVTKRMNDAREQNVKMLAIESAVQKLKATLLTEAFANLTLQEKEALIAAGELLVSLHNAAEVGATVGLK